MGHFCEEVIEHGTWGMRAADALLSGTRDAARCPGVDAVTGTLEPGKAADVLVVDGDPLADLGALRRVRAVFLAGSPIQRGPAGD